MEARCKMDKLHHSQIAILSFVMPVAMVANLIIVAMVIKCYRMSDIIIYYDV